MYREGLWVMGQYSGHASPKATNLRIRRLIEQGQKGFSVALDLPTDWPRFRRSARPGRGRQGRRADRQRRGREGAPSRHPPRRDPPDPTTANAIGPIALALLVVASEELGFSPKQFRVMLQNDSLKEYVARGTYIFPCARAAL